MHLAGIHVNSIHWFEELLLRRSDCVLALVIDEGSKLSYSSLYFSTSTLGLLSGWRLTDRPTAERVAMGHSLI